MASVVPGKSLMDCCLVWKMTLWLCFCLIRYVFVSLMYCSGSSSVSSVNFYYSAFNSFSFSELTVFESNLSILVRGGSKGLRYCGNFYFKVRYCGFHSPSSCGKFKFCVAVVGEKIVVSRWSASFSWQEDTNPKRSPWLACVTCVHSRGLYCANSADKSYGF